MTRRLSLGDRLAGVAMLGALALGAPAAALGPKDPADRAYASAMQDLLKAQHGGPKDPPHATRLRGPVVNLERQYRRSLELVFRRVTGQRMTAAQYQRYRKAMARGWCPATQADCLAIRFLWWLKERAEEQAPAEGMRA